MERPSKKDIKAALDRLKSPGGPTEPPQMATPGLQEKKANKHRIRKKGV